MKFTVMDLWHVLGNIPIDEDECIELEFLHFEVGTNRFYIWDWFENTFDIPAYKLMIGGYIK
jgi:hypothetical protein